MIRALLWKEWSEHRWRLAFGCVLLMAYMALGLKTRLVEDEAIFGSGLMLGAGLLPLLAVMGAVAEDRAEGTLARLLELPVRPWLVLLVKTLMGLAVCVGPLAGATAVALVMAGGREVSAAMMVKLCGNVGGVTALFFVWSLAFAVRQPSEARAALVAIAVAAAWWLTLMLIIGRPHGWVVYIHYVHPLGFAKLTWNGSQQVAIVIQVAMAGLLWWWAARRLAASAGRSA